MRTLARSLALVASLAALAAAAQETRQLNRIPTPQPSSTRLPPGARAVATVKPVSPEHVREAVQRLAASWNTPQLAAFLAPNFYAKDRLLDTIAAQVPRDAALRVLDVQGIQTLAQYLQKEPDGSEQLVSRVSATVRTQVEFNDPRAGFRRLDGTNEIVLLVREPAQ